MKIVKHRNGNKSIVLDGWEQLVLKVQLENQITTLKSFDRVNEKPMWETEIEILQSIVDGVSD